MRVNVLHRKFCLATLFPQIQMLWSGALCLLSLKSRLPPHQLKIVLKNGGTMSRTQVLKRTSLRRLTTFKKLEVVKQSQPLGWTKKSKKLISMKNALCTERSKSQQQIEGIDLLRRKYVDRKQRPIGHNKGKNNIRIFHKIDNGTKIQNLIHKPEII